MDEVKAKHEADLLKQREVFSRILPDDIPQSFKCSLCEKDAKMIRLTPQVALYYHDCPAYEGIKELTNSIAIWVKRSFGEFNVEHGVIQVDINE